MDLATLQLEHRDWLAHNFPDQVAYQPLLGLAEEVGELCHAHLKGEQQIRQDSPMTNYRDKVDAIGDIVIYLASYCNSNGIDLDGAVTYTWQRVKERDWVANPRDGSV